MLEMATKLLNDTFAESHGVFNKIQHWGTKQQEGKLS